eukprot:TRINITY_DN44903_c0_g1_i1.p2 TRINITY_DN44903_c0_g1~~TRINITY_DN44903_c0_g1_i1.p2  ORF type:complete len:314 (+),score=84.40 TRINITY_DN44903_c0_g1_i1:45-944(+)
MLRASSAMLASGINTVAILGGGLMGTGIATICAAGNKRAFVVDVDEKRCAAAQKNFTKAIGWVNKTPRAFMNRNLDLETATNLVTFTTNRKDAVQQADLVIEAVPELLDLKIKTFTEVASEIRPGTILATNTSSLAVADMQNPLPAETRPNFVGLHYFSPVEKMALVEIVRGEDTSEDVVSRCKDFCEETGKTAIICKDTPGFAVNRLLVPLMLEACRMAERGDCSIEDIDKAMQFGAGHPMGPFRLADMVGIDVLKHIIDGWHAKYPDVQLFEPSKLVNEKFAAGHFGMKSGQGFYKY